MGTEHTKNSYTDLIETDLKKVLSMSRESTVSIANKIDTLLEKAFKEVEP